MLLNESRLMNPKARHLQINVTISHTCHWSASSGICWSRHVFMLKFQFASMSIMLSCIWSRCISADPCRLADTFRSTLELWNGVIICAAFLSEPWEHLHKPPINLISFNCNVFPKRHSQYVTKSVLNFRHVHSAMATIYHQKWQTSHFFKCLSLNGKTHEKWSAWDEIHNEIPSTYILLIGKHKRNSPYKIKAVEKHSKDIHHQPVHGQHIRHHQHYGQHDIQAAK